MRLLYLSLVFLLFVCITDLVGYELRLHYLDSYIENDNLFSSAVANTDTLVSVIRRFVDSGVVVVFNYRLDLLEEVFGFDKVLSEVYLYRKVYYDFFTKEYVVLVSETMKETRNTNLNLLLEELNFIDSLLVSSLEDLDKDGTYYFRTRLSMQLENAYPYLAIFFNLITPIQYRIKWLKTKTFMLDSLY